MGRILDHNGGAGICDHLYYERTGDFTGIQPDLDPADLDPAGIRLLVLCLCKTGDRYEICRKRLIKTKLDTSPYLMQKAEVVEDLRVGANRQMRLWLII